jgi:peptide/nickel transport system ATP-binding protein
VPGDLCKTQMPELLAGDRGPGHTKRCHLVDPESIYQTEILPEIAPDLVDEIINQDDRGADAEAGTGLYSGTEETKN